MAGSLFFPPRTRELDAAAGPVALARAYFYASGTTTPATVYQDSGLTTPHTSPVLADVGGRFPAIWLDPLVTYSVTITDGSGATLYTLDPYAVPVSSGAGVGALLYPRTAAEIAAAVTPTNYQYAPGNVLRYGADPTAVAVSTAAFQAAVDANSNVWVPAGTYRIRTVAIPSNVTISGEGYASHIQRDASWVGTAQALFVIGNDAADVSNVSVSHLRFNANGANSFMRLIQIGQTTISGTLYTSSNVRITDCRFMDSAPFASAGDKWAILWRSKLENVWVERCHSSDDMQLTAGGSDVYKNINVLNNRVVDGRANGIAMSTGDENHVVDGVKVVGNYIECQALCVFLGPDAIYEPFTGGTWNDVLIANNTCTTNPDNSSDDTWQGVYCNASQVTYKNVRVTGNHIQNRETLVSQRGVRFVDENTYGTTVSEAVVSGNTIENCRVGVDLLAAGRVAVNGNVITNCTDGVVADEVGLSSVIGNNLITGGTRAILVNNAELLVTGNNCSGGAGQTGTTAGRLTIAPATGKTAKVMAVGNKFTDGSGGTNIYGVYGSVVGTAELHLIDNDLRGNDGAVNNITPTVARGNLGYATSNGGVTTAIATGTTVAHGLAAAPTIVTVTATSSGPTDLYVSSINATNFTINYGGGGTHTFAWDAKTAQHYG